MTAAMVRRAGLHVRYATEKYPRGGTLWVGFALPWRRSMYRVSTDDFAPSYPCYWIGMSWPWFRFMVTPL